MFRISRKSIIVIATLSMLIDHIGAVFFPSIRAFRIIGRIAFILYADMIATGVIKTRNLRNYLLRLTLFSLCSQMPYNLVFGSTEEVFLRLNIGFTLLIGALLCAAFEAHRRVQEHCGDAVVIAYRVFLLVAVIATILLSALFGVDYGPYGIIAILLMYAYEKSRGTRVEYVLWSILTALLVWLGAVFFPSEYAVPTQCFAALAMPFILLRNSRKETHTWNIGYWFYPVHLILIYWAKNIPLFASEF